MKPISNTAIEIDRSKKMPKMRNSSKFITISLFRPFYVLPCPTSCRMRIYIYAFSIYRKYLFKMRQITIIVLRHPTIWSSSKRTRPSYIASHYFISCNIALCSSLLFFYCYCCLVIAMGLSIFTSSMMVFTCGDSTTPTNNKNRILVCTER